MRKKLTFLLLSKLYWSFLLLCPIIANAQTDRPNIILITADDLGMHLGYLGDTIARSPILDMMAENGAIFSNAYVTQSTCSPSRSSILTGQYNFQNGHYGQWRHGYTVNENLTTLPEFLKSQGYATGIIGKLAVNPVSKFPFDLFEVDPHRTRQVTVVKSMAKQFFIDHEETPKFLMINYLDPHRSYTPERFGGIPKELQDQDDVVAFPFLGVDSPELRKDIAGYYNSIARMDYGIGLLLKALEELDAAQNTLIIFISDHGAPFERGKATNYESGLKVPMIFYSPGFIPENMVVNDFVSSLDIYASIVDFSTQGQIELDIEGQSLFPAILQSKSLEREYTFGEFNSHGRDHFYPRRSISDGNFKLIHNILYDYPNPMFDNVQDENAINLALESCVFEVQAAYRILRQPPEFELYELSMDPNEFNELSENPKFQDKLVNLKQELMDWRVKKNDPFLDDLFLNSQIKAHNLSLPIVKNNPPVISNITGVFSIQEDGNLTLELKDFNIVDDDNSNHEGFSIWTKMGTNYSSQCNVIIPELNFDGQLNVPVIISDGVDFSNEIEIIIEISPVNDDPIILGTSRDLLIEEDNPFELLITDLIISDVDNLFPEDFTLGIRSGENYSVNENIITPNMDFFGTLNIPLIINDGISDSEEFDVFLEVTAINDQPNITGTTTNFFTNEDNTFELVFEHMVVSDVDNNYPKDFTISINTGDNYTVNNLVVTPLEGFTGYLSATVTVNDGIDDSNEFDIEIEVVPSITTNIESKGPNVKLFPNPTLDIVTLELPPTYRNFEITIYGVLGKIKEKLQITSKSTLDLDFTDYLPGLYFIHINFNDYQIVRSVLKK